jgi:transcriptional regulator with XRE-family HTH domain
MDVTKGANIMSAGILDGFQTIIPTAAAVLSERRRQMLRMTQQEVADRANITLRQYQRLESGERSILTCSFGLACRVIEALDMDVSKFYHGDYYLEELKTIEGK